MSEHFPKSTESATAWCKPCNRMTVHRVDDGRLGPCLDPAHPARPAKPVPPPKPPQSNLFGETK